MKVKVIKPIKGLEVGDILTFNDDSYNYELIKETSDITENASKISKYKYSLSEYIIKNNNEYFQFVDENGVPVTLVEGEDINKITKFYDKNIEDTTVTVDDSKDKVISDLKEENKKLQEKLDSIKWISKDEYNRIKFFNSLFN